MSKDYYNILGVGKTASKEDIKKAFREKAHLFHPDKPGGDEKKFKEINEAYQVLANDEKRQQYDQFGSDFTQQGGFGGGMGWEDIMRQARQGGGSYSNVDFDMGDLGDILGGMFGGGFGGGSRRRRETRGRDIEIGLELEFKEAVFGADKKIELIKLISCEHCHGNGAEPGSKIVTCKACDGKGQVHKMQRTILGNIQTIGACDECRGEGKINEKNCTQCDGQGRIKQKVQMDVKISAGLNNGMSLKMAGQGEAGIKSGKAGDLYIHIHVKSDPYFKREGDDILTQTEISYSLAALGGKISVQTVDGEVDLKIPAATQSGKVFILRGKGVTRFQHYGRGDQLVEVLVKTPEKLNRRQKELLEELGKEGI
ncbi:MAG: molecular chaperone DnaJ [Candidatus Parcubacteria bacterium]|nr:molecular chaperone DnaJ [Candidatus Parcubacteria bacterium]